MGACCTCQTGLRYRSAPMDDHHAKPKDIEPEDSNQVIAIGDCGARIRLQGSTKFISMFTRQGRKGVNQDAMTVWENFGGKRDMVYCGVFDGHGPFGHKVSCYVRNTLPSKLSWLFRDSDIHGKTCSHHGHGSKKKVINIDDSKDPVLSSWKKSIVESFKEMDEDLEANKSIDSYGSGSTSVSVIKQGNNLIITNLGDSRALLCTRNGNQLHTFQLTVDLKPNTKGEYERIKSCGGRVQAMEHYGLICIPNIYYHKLTDKDEFVVLATDGVWDVLTNNEVVKIVGSVRNRSMAARFLIDNAMRAWRHKYPSSKTDDCSEIKVRERQPRKHNFSSEGHVKDRLMDSDEEQSGFRCVYIGISRRFHFNINSELTVFTREVHSYHDP
ncbi:unnamed protein product [Lactuca virosa]|uniref:PPM-type phosphatase domain-containing protein n=1 Tax=Lactuca virosa TaxID=75947 RepID=A0AAU9N2F0_9ASTR|nr:unnamed protein product [Lactuca virosa]